VIHLSNLSEESRKEAQRIAKNIADQLDALKYAFLQMGEKNREFKREYLCQWVDVTPAPFSQHELDLQMWREDRIKRVTESKPREDDPMLYGDFGYTFINMRKGEENGND
jgi:hypothetical protein